ncbi:hypothetical protein BJ742DRAFT_854486 [Cladochytrium replicatum]|nr:hypothetical protein BJ742DRAFT_854486 [Cladochytrium replicatum]
MTLIKLFHQVSHIGDHRVPIARFGNESLFKANMKGDVLLLEYALPVGSNPVNRDHRTPRLFLGDYPRSNCDHGSDVKDQLPVSTTHELIGEVEIASIDIANTEQTNLPDSLVPNSDPSSIYTHSWHSQRSELPPTSAEASDEPPIASVVAKTSLPGENVRVVAVPGVAATVRSGAREAYSSDGAADADASFLAESDRTVPLGSCTGAARKIPAQLPWLPHIIHRHIDLPAVHIEIRSLHINARKASNPLPSPRSRISANTRFSAPTSRSCSPAVVVLGRRATYCCTTPPRFHKHSPRSPNDYSANVAELVQVMQESLSMLHLE